MISKSLLAGLMAFAAETVGLPAPAALPTVCVGPSCMSLPDTAAEYHDGTISIRHCAGPIIDGRIAPDLRCQSYLVHELVHHAQAAAGVTWSCFLEREQPAYVAQVAYVEEFGISDGQHWLFGDDLLAHMVLHAQSCEVY